MKNRYRTAFLLLLVVLPLAVMLSAASGAFKISPFQIMNVMMGDPETPAFRVLAYIRFPRVVLAVLVGASLAVAGASLQGLFRNPLASPGLIGVTSGASLGAAIWIVLVGSGFLKYWGVPIAAFSGAALVTFTIWRIAAREGRIATATLLLGGIAINSITGALIGLLTYLADDDQLRSLTFWQLGGLTQSSWKLVMAATPLSLAGMLILLGLSKAFNAMALGEREAFHLGIRIERMKQLAVIGAALSVGAAVATSGGIGFIGLVVPHLLRITMGSDHRWLLPTSALGGALLLVLADLAARTIAQPSEIPVGILTSLLGGPFFLWMLIQNRKELIHA